MKVEPLNIKYIAYHALVRQVMDNVIDNFGQRILILSQRRKAWEKAMSTALHYEMKTL
jgi:hypothetical protein